MHPNPLVAACGLDSDCHQNRWRRRDIGLPRHAAVFSTAVHLVTTKPRIQKQATAACCASASLRHFPVALKVARGLQWHCHALGSTVSSVSVPSGMLSISNRGVHLLHSKSFCGPQATSRRCVRESCFCRSGLPSQAKRVVCEEPHMSTPCSSPAPSKWAPALVHSVFSCALIPFLRGCWCKCQLRVPTNLQRAMSNCPVRVGSSPSRSALRWRSAWGRALASSDIWRNGEWNGLASTLSELVCAAPGFSRADLKCGDQARLTATPHPSMRLPCFGVVAKLWVTGRIAPLQRRWKAKRLSCRD